MQTLVNDKFTLHLFDTVSEESRKFKNHINQKKNIFIGYLHVGDNDCSTIDCSNMPCSNCQIRRICENSNTDNFANNVISEYFPPVKLEYPEYFI